METGLTLTIATAATVACLHTVAGPDHYIPFIALAKSRQWKFGKTVFWTITCGCAHVWSSVLLGLGGAAIGWSIQKTGWLENVRGNLAGWALLPHKHFDSYEDGSMYVYEHRHGVAVNTSERHKVTPWVLFIIFLLGPCEPMIPLLFVPAVKNNVYGMVMLVAVYTVVTLATMLFMVMAGYWGLTSLKTKIFERYMHAIAGLTLFVCGAGMVWMGW